jgi:hypothetical protein
MSSKIDKLPVYAFFAAQKMPLNFDENIFVTERVDQKLRALFNVPGSARILRAPVGILPNGKSRQDAAASRLEARAPLLTARMTLVSD